VVTVFLLAAGLALVRWGLPAAGRALVVSDELLRIDAAVVLSTGVDYYSRLIEAARLFRDGRVDWVVINGDRKSDSLRRLESLGFQPAATWDENSLRILELLKVPRTQVIAVSAPDVYDTVSEARVVGSVLLDRGFHDVAVTTSKFHTRRARHIWSNLYAGRLTVAVSPAAEDPYDPATWWRDGRQIRQTLSEYGGWLFYWWGRATARFGGVVEG
jgi:uncharacterized SAM-binding protein YcdF (DUF218 family)